MAFGNVRLLRLVGSDTGVSTFTLDDGAFEGQKLTLIGGSDSEFVRINDGGNAALALVDRDLGHNDSLGLIWTSGVWVEVFFSNN